MAIISRNEVEELWVTRIGVAPVFIAAVLPFVIGVVVLLKCVFNHCCVRKTTTKEELFGVEGRMTILSQNEHALTTNNTSQRATNAVSLNNNNSRPCSSISMAAGSIVHDSKKQTSHLLQSSGPMLAADTVDGSDSLLETVDLTDSLRAAVKRQLPAPPQSPNHAPRRSSSMLSHDGTSELYATVEEVPSIKNSTVAAAGEREHLYAKVIKPKLAKGKSLGDQPSSSKGTARDPSSDSETYASSLTNPHHPYAKIKRPNSIEHPYAKVGVTNRIRTESTETAGDDAEETDTDNYDVAHPYALINKARTDHAQGSSRSTRSGSAEVDNENTALNNQPSTSAQSSRRRSPEPDQAEEDVPVPPRRLGRQWRRGSNPQPNATENQENQATFSGDSQDSRGYSHLSVREPLSTIKAQTKKASDPNYAFMSDDSEEMYAAIEDPSDANYMSIDRPSRLGPTSLISPIPERREANSPLPPPPLVSSPPPAVESPLAANPSSGPAIYAQVTKRKKNKAPPTPSADTNGQPHAQLGADTPSKPKQKADPINVSASSASAQLAAAEAEPRRWSKADISYSEFEVIRESLFPSTSTSGASQIKHKSFNGENYASIGADALLDEDNYNIIPEPRIRSQVPRQPERHSSRHESMYQEIDEVTGSNRAGKHTYQELPHRSNASTSDDHYHGIGSNRRRKRNKSNEKKSENNAPGMYQRANAKTTEGEDSDDEDEEGFYEKVKAKPRPQDKPNSSSNANMDSKKHGYEKLKRKPTENNVNANISDDDDDGFYEKVKCPPKIPSTSTPQEQGHNSKNSNHHPAQPSKESVLGASAKSVVSHNHIHAGRLGSGGDEDVHNAEVDQLYARIDKTRKKKPEHTVVAVDEGKFVKNHQPAAPTYEPSKSTSASTSKAHSSKSPSNWHGSSGNERRNEPILTLTKDVTIEYI